jgi:beta-glucosidase
VAHVVGHHLQLAHGLAVRAMRATGIPARIGPAFNLHPTYPVDDSPAAAVAARLVDGYENRFYLDSALRGTYPEDVVADLGANSPFARAVRDGDLDLICAPVDLLAVQYYCPIYVGGDNERVERWPTSEATWQQIYPEGLYDILTRVHREYGDIPISITENGIPCADVLGVDDAVDDAARVVFLRDHFAAAHRAIADGVPLESYHVWSLLDNFEWNSGYAQRWGLVYVDYPTQRRVLKRSARWYRGVIEENAL